MSKWRPKASPSALAAQAATEEDEAPTEAAAIAAPPSEASAAAPPEAPRLKAHESLHLDGTVYGPGGSLPVPMDRLVALGLTHLLE